MQYQQYIGGGKSSAQFSACENFFLKNTTSGNKSKVRHVAGSDEKQVRLLRF